MRFMVCGLWIGVFDFSGFEAEVFTCKSRESRGADDVPHGGVKGEVEPTVR